MTGTHDERRRRRRRRRKDPPLLLCQPMSITRTDLALSSFPPAERERERRKRKGAFGWPVFIRWGKGRPPRFRTRAEETLHFRKGGERVEVV